MTQLLTPYEKVKISRHPKRPTTFELIKLMAEHFVELHGDRNFLDDKAVIGGLAKIGGRGVIVVGHQKGMGTTKDNIYRNFGMPRPEGYRKALRLMSMAERFALPVLSLVDTPGAFPGVDAEERGQSEAIAKNIMVMARLKIPIVSIVVGEGGSGGALALAVANKVHMLENAVYSVISPEGCASILMKDASHAPWAASSLKMTAQDALELGIIDSIIKEFDEGAHASHEFTADAIKQCFLKDLLELEKFSPEELKAMRMTKYMDIGRVANH